MSKAVMFAFLVLAIAVSVFFVSSASAQHPKTVKAPVVIPSYLDRHK